MYKQYDCLALFSGGLDSVLACKLIQSQGLKVLGLHFVSPFFGNEDKLSTWQKIYNIDLFAVHVHQEFIDLLLQGPPHGLGKGLNPCVDCKILMLKKARQLLEQFQAEFLVTGEVLGQRPMSQRKDTLNLITKQAGVRDLLLRPLCAQKLPPTPMEITGRVDRESLLGIQGRGRKKQLQLARDMSLVQTPTPAGGCLLTEPETVKRFWPVLKNVPYPTPEDFKLSNVGRQYWSGQHWLVIGRHLQDNQKLLHLVQDRDLLFKLVDIPGPIAIARQFRDQWSQTMINSAAEFVLQFSSKARQASDKVRVRVGSLAGNIQELNINPGHVTQKSIWREASWQDFQKDKIENASEKTPV